MQRIFENVLLVCDMDGTLLNSSDEISPENKNAMQYFVDHGGILTVATGRKEQSVEPFLQDLPINAPAIVYNGSVIYDFKKKSVVWEMKLEGGIADVLIEVSHQFPEVGIEIYQGNTILLVRGNSFTEFHRSKEHYSKRLHAIDAIDFPWRKVLFASDSEDLTRVEGHIEQHFVNGDMPFRMCRSERIFLEWLPLGVSKGNALEVLRQECGYMNHMTVTVGNETNDLEMLRAPYTGFAVANAHPEAKRAASNECAHHNDDAIADVIQWIEKLIKK